MSILVRLNFRRHLKTLRTLDYENMNPASMSDHGAGTTGRLSDSIYEGTSRVPAPADRDDGLLATDDGHLPMPGDRPHPKAQWDDVAGAWVVWDPEADDWLPVDGGS